MSAAALSLTVGTAGHIDHGKSALVAALTGTHPDRLAEEKRRGITIDLGFAHLDLPLAAGGSLRVGFIDVPGHERFVRNMLAGAAGLDLVVLVVAADAGVQPQTREHFDICRLLGVEHGLVALAKSDLADAARLAAARAEIAALVRGSFLAAAPVLPVSAKTGAGLDGLRRALAAAAERIARRNRAAPARLPLDRVFTLRGFGTVVTGTLLAGRIAPGDELELLGSAAGPRRVRVRGVQVHGHAVACAFAGERTAINLAAIEPAALARGMVLAEAGVFRAAARLDVELELLAAAPPLKHRAPVHLHALSAASVARVTLLDRPRLEPGAMAYAQLRLAAPLPLVPGDRFILRQFSPLATIGGGRVVDAAPAPGRRDAARAAALARLAHASQDERFALLVARAGSTGVALADLAPALGLRRRDLEAALRRPAAARLAVLAQRLLTAEQIGAWERQVVQRLAAFHAAEPLAPGLAAEALRAGLVPARWRRPDAAPLVRALLAQLQAAARIELLGEWVRLPGHGPRLDRDEREARERIAAAFRAAGLRAPAVEEVLAGSQVERRRAGQLLQMLVREGDLVRVGEDLVLHRDALEALRRQLAERKARAPRLSVPDFKQLTGVSRKYAIPLLEYLDRARVTRRVGDLREIL